MKIFPVTLIALLPLALAAKPLKSVIVTFPKGTPAGVISDAESSLVAAVSNAYLCLLGSWSWLGWTGRVALSLMNIVSFFARHGLVYNMGYWTLTISGLQTSLSMLSNSQIPASLTNIILPVDSRQRLLRKLFRLSPLRLPNINQKLKKTRWFLWTANNWVWLPRMIGPRNVEHVGKWRFCGPFAPDSRLGLLDLGRFPQYLWWCTRAITRNGGRIVFLGDDHFWLFFLWFEGCF